MVASPIIQGNQLDRYASQKTTVSEEQIQDLNAQDVASALRKTPGINISRYNPIGSFGGAAGGAIFIRDQGPTGLIPEFGLTPGVFVLDGGTGPGGRICAFDLSWPTTSESRKGVNCLQGRLYTHPF